MVEFDPTQAEGSLPEDRVRGGPRRGLPAVPRPERRAAAQGGFRAAEERGFGAAEEPGTSALRGLAKLGKLAKFCKFLTGSFSAVSNRKISSKNAFDSIFKLYKICIHLHRCNLKILAEHQFEKSAICVKIQRKNCTCRKICKILPNFKNFSLIIW